MRRRTSGLSTYIGNASAILLAFHKAFKPYCTYFKCLVSDSYDILQISTVHNAQKNVKNIFTASFKYIPRYQLAYNVITCFYGSKFHSQFTIYTVFMVIFCCTIDTKINALKPYKNSLCRYIFIFKFIGK